MVMGQLILVALLMTTTLFGYSSGIGCSDEVLQECTNCGPGPDCPDEYSIESSIPHSSHCSTQCKNDTACLGSWFMHSPGQLGQCAYYNCTQVQQQCGNTSFRKSCANDTSCLSYEILRYENQMGQCVETANSSLPSLNTTSEYECLQACLDTVGCRSATFNGVKCGLHSCDTNTAGTGSVFWKRNCHKACANETIQRCVNCGPSADCQAPYYTIQGLVSSQTCANECNSRADCGTSYHNVSGNVCEFSECDQTGMSVNMVSSRSACYTECSKYELFELANMTANCAPYASETSGTTAHVCLDRCLDSSSCRSISFDQTTNTCYHYTCTESISQPGSLFYWRNCVEPCDRLYTETCIDCDASSSCTPMVNETLYSSVDCDNLCTATQSCNMAVFKPIDNVCNLFECSTVETSLGTTVYRRTCSNDCLHYKIEILTSGSITCPDIGEEVGGVDLTFCMTRCLDMIGCRAVTFNALTNSCRYHNCSEFTALAMVPNQTIVRRICVDPEPDRIYTQECLNCNINSANCPSYFDAPQNYVSTECDAVCNVTAGCTAAVFNYGECLLYDCMYVTQAYGVTTFRRTYTPECLQFKIHTLEGQFGTCTILNTTVEYPDYTQCLAGCLDYTGCMAMTYMPSNQTCWFHSCDSYASSPTSTGLVFVQRQCNQTACERLYIQECVNCDIHERSNWAFSFMGDMAITSNCSARCNESVQCGTSVYNPTQSTCKRYNQTGLRMAWGKTATRKSCRSDCPKFKLTERTNKTGACVTLETHYDIPTLDDCVHLCLDLNGCLGTTFYTLTLTCNLHECANITNSGADTTKFVYLTCDVEECAKTNQQVCMNCAPGPNCQLAMDEHEESSLTQECEARCNKTDCLAAYFEMPEGTCYTFNCGQLTPYQRYHRMYRKSCTNDCPIYEIYMSQSIGSNCVDLGDSGMDRIPSIYYCIEACLDIEDCRVVNYNSTISRCTYHSQCADVEQNRTGYFYATRECVSDDPPVGDLIQTCHNCGIGPDCQHQMSDSLTSKYFDYECQTFCLNSTNCRELQYNADYSACLTYQCTQVGQRIGHTIYRRTNNTDCQEFELFTFADSAGNCTVIGQYTHATGAAFCMDICLDMQHCRGITYYDSDELCYFHNCTDYTESKDNTFIKRVCSQDFDVCVRTEKQTCIDCSKGPSCQSAFEHNSEFLPRNINTSLIGVDSNYKLIWFDPDVNKTKNMYCSEVDMAVGNILHRATCTNDCPKFEIFIHTETVGDCGASILSTISGGISLHYCISKCLDMTGCRSINFNNVNASCDFYSDCNITAQNQSFTFFRRVCIDEATECIPDTLQTCLNCEISDYCQDQFNQTSQNYFLGECYDLKNAEPESDAAWYDKVNNQCNVYQCDLVDFRISNTVYRNSCDQDCTEYELFRNYDVEGTCDVIGEDAGSVTIQYCMDRCLSMTGCRATTFYGNSSLCYYHNCNNKTGIQSGLNTTFIERNCVTGECIRIYTQVCLNCMEGPNCQRYFTNLPNYPTWEECHNNTEHEQHTGQITYYEKSGSCRAINCSLLIQGEESVVIRKSCASDCPIFRIGALYSYASTCPVIGQDEGGVTIDFCLSRCLDMPGCRAISFTWDINIKCEYHSCTDKVANSSSFYFMWRECINETQENVLEPVKPFTQRCLNCGLKCWNPISSQAGVTRDTDCNVTCPGCDMTWYNPVTETCFQYGCDRIYAPLVPSVVFFRTENSDCKEYEVFFYISRHATCDVIHYEEGLVDQLYCLRHCMDVPGCRSVAYDFTNRNCTFYGCNTYTEGSYNWFMERVCTDETNHLLKSSTSCVSPTFQTCVNCDLDSSLCQSSYSSSVSTDSACQFDCGFDPNCEAAVYTNGTCTQSQCDVVTPRTDTSSTLYRKICFTEDCPVFEVHQLSSHFGVCDVIRTEELQFNPGLCFERCLRMTGCRAITFWTRYSKCLYHSCDCSYDYVDAGFETVFMWRYCIADVNNSTLLTNSTSPPKEFPDCQSTTTTVSTTTTTVTVSTTTLMSTTTAGPTSLAISTSALSSTSVAILTVAPTLSPNLTNIYLRSCLCSKGMFGNLTVEEISSQLIQNLTIDLGETGASKRRYISIVDNRESAVAIGTVGVLVLVLEFCTFLLVDSSRIIHAIQILHGFFKKPTG